MDDTPDLSTLTSLLNNIKNTNDKDSNPSSFDISNILNSFSKNNENLSDDTLDFNTIIKLSKILKQTNNKSPTKDLLTSLKPFLKDSRKSKVDNYIKLVGIGNIIEILKSDSGDKNE